MVVISVFFSTTKAQDNSLRPVTSKYALTNATIIQGPGRTIEKGSILIDNGLIKAIGSSISLPADAWIIEADSMYIYPGFISGLSAVGVKSPKDEKIEEDKKQRGNPSYKRAGITPNESVRDLLDPKEKSVDEFRKLGFTASHVVSQNGMMPGTGSLILLGGENGESMLFRENISLFSQWQGANGVYPSTIIAIMAKYRDMYRKAEQSLAYSQAYDSNPNGMERPNPDQMIEALYPVVSKNLPVHFKTENVLDITRALTLQKELGFKLILGEVKQAWDIIPQIKNSKAPVFLSLDLPEKEDKEDSESEEKEEDEKDAPTPEEIEKEALEKRKKEMIEKYYTQASLLHSQGVSFGFSTFSSKSKDVKIKLRQLKDKGLSEDQLLAALTTTPARTLGVSSQMGSLDVGKMANLMITNKPYFEEDSRVAYVFVDGVKYEYKEKEKKSSSSDSVSVGGKWNYTVESPQGVRKGVIKITEKGDDYEGVIIRDSGEETQLQEITVDGNTLSFSYVVNFGQEITVNVEVEVDEDTFEGNLTLPNFGSFPIEASREPEF